MLVIPANNLAPTHTLSLIAKHHWVRVISVLLIVACQTPKHVLVIKDVVTAHNAFKAAMK